MIRRTKIDFPAAGDERANTDWRAEVTRRVNNGFEFAPVAWILGETGAPAVVADLSPYHYVPTMARGALLMGTVRLPHGWTGTALTPVVTWVQLSAGAASQTLNFAVLYAWAVPGSALPTGGSYGGMALAQSLTQNVPGAAGRVVESRLTDIPAGNKYGDVLCLTVTRNFAAETYSGNIGLLQFGVIYERDVVGSKERNYK